MAKKKHVIDFDNPWKEAIFKKFEAFMQFFFPAAHEQIDWTHKVVFLETELRIISKKAKSGMRRADALAKVHLKDGREQWVLIHIEVQSQRDQKFAERMYIYNYRIFERYKRRVASFAILADEHDDWRPCEYSHEILGTRSTLQFSTAKLRDFRFNFDALRNHTNPFASLVFAHLKTQETRGLPSERLTWKISLLKNLFRCGMSKDDIREMIRVVDWLMDLPDNLQIEFESKLKELEEPNPMAYVTTFEKWGRRDGIEIGLKRGRRLGKKEGLESGLEKGREEGREEGRVVELRSRINALLELRFGNVPQRIEKAIEVIDSMSRLDVLFKSAATVKSLDEFEI